MALEYKIIEVLTSEEAKYKGQALHVALVRRIHDMRMAIRCLVTRGLGGCYENGEAALQGIEVLSFNMPVKIEILLPASELGLVMPVIEEMVEEGVVLVRDAGICLYKVKAGLLPRNLRVSEIMTPNPSAVKKRTRASEVISILLSGSFNSIPVIDEQGRPVGIVTQGDLIRRAGMPIRLGLLRDMTRENLDATLAAMSQRYAGDIMTSPVITVNGDLEARRAVRQMLDNGLKRMPVVTREGILCGMLSRFDIFRTITGETHEWKAMQERQIRVEDIKRVGEIMRLDARAVKPDTPLEEVMKIIDENDIRRVMVVDKSGRLMGMIFDRDLLGLFEGHGVGIWDRIAGRLTFTAMGQRHRAVLEAAKRQTAGEIMKKDLITVGEDTTLDEAVRIMTEHQIKLLPVLSSDGVFLGVVTRRMLLSLHF